MKYCDGTPLVPAEVRKRWESSYGGKLGQLTLYEAATNAESAATAAASTALSGSRRPGELKARLARAPGSAIDKSGVQKRRRP